jgi:hypothetical protein
MAFNGLLPDNNEGHFTELSPVVTPLNDHNYQDINLYPLRSNRYFPREITVSGSMQDIDLQPTGPIGYSGPMPAQFQSTGDLNSAITELPTVWLGSLPDPARG